MYCEQWRDSHFRRSNALKSLFIYEFHLTIFFSWKLYYKRFSMGRLFLYGVADLPVKSLFQNKKSLSRGFVWYIEIRTHWGLRDDRVLFSGHKWRDQTEKIPQKDKDRTSALVLHVWIRKSTGFYATQDHQDIFVNITTCLYTWSKTFSFYSPDKH